MLFEELRIISKDLNENGEENRSISALGLSTYTYNVLKRAGFMTITDIVIFPESQWRRVYRLGVATAKELEEKMQKIGYPNFKIEL